MVVYRELSTIERELGISAKTLYSVSNSLDRHYRAVSIPKRDGSFRRLSVSDELLKRIQRAIADKLLAYEPISQYATAYRVAVDIRKNALPHVGKPKLLKLDIKSFFDSITYSLVKETAFPSEKYSEPIRILLAMLCYRGESLPQGAPSSPVISNIVMRDFDETVGRWCNERSVSYTRYCDDMTFSGDFDHNELIATVSEKLRSMGLFLNGKKTSVIGSEKRQSVTGMVVNRKINVSSDYKREIRKEVYYCLRYGVKGHLLMNNNNIHPKIYLQRLLGRINYVLKTSPDDGKFIEYREKVIALLKEYK